MKSVTIYTDGACSGNPGPGGWACIIEYQGAEKCLSGYEPETTNNRMEMTAAIEALMALKEPCEVLCHTDSTYLSNAFNRGWLINWQANGWKNSSKKPVENRDLWERLLKLASIHRVRWIKVPGHADDERNNRCDSMAKAAIKSGRDLLGNSV